MRTYEERRAEFYKRFKEANFPVTLLTEYTRMHDPMTFICVCGKEHTSTPQGILKRNTCGCKLERKKEATKKRNEAIQAEKAMTPKKQRAPKTYRTHEQFVKEVRLANPRLKVVGTFKSVNSKIEFICECGVPHSSRAGVLLRGQGCGCRNITKKEKELVIKINRDKYNI